MEKNITMLVAHPDDEVIFGWMVLKEAKKILCCSNDLYNPQRAWCKDRVKALREIGKLVGAEVVCLDYDSEFYRTSVRDGKLNSLVDNVLNMIEHETPADGILFTHNSWGEYGNIDHILVHQVARMSGKRLIVPDIAMDAGWFGVRNFYNHHTKAGFENDLDFYYKCKAIYDKYGSWTWSKHPVRRSEIYEIDNSII